jgi:hypothetical protein
VFSPVTVVEVLVAATIVEMPGGILFTVYVDIGYPLEGGAV